MDMRIPLSPGTLLIFQNHIGGKVSYTIQREVGRGGSCIVYDASYATNVGDYRSVRIKECYPFGLRMTRVADGALSPESEDADAFDRQKASLKKAFHQSNRLFAIDSLTNSVTNTVDWYEANNTCYVVSTYLNGETFAEHEKGSLSECIRIVKSAAVALQHIHETGYLYLDLKPENIFVIKGTTELIQLFDFDSMVCLDDLKLGKKDDPLRISYSKGFAALEQQMGRIRRFGFYTDVYAVGAVLFDAIFGRTPTAFDCDEYAQYDYQEMVFPENRYPDRLFQELTRFFHHSLSGYAPARYQTMSEAIVQLEIIAKYADETMPYILSTPISAPQYCVGRDEDIRQLDTLLSDPQHEIVSLCGMGGIGKSTLAMTYLSRNRDKFDTILYLYCRGSIRQLIVDDSQIHLNTVEKLSEESENDYYNRKLGKIKSLTHGQRAILVLDNYEWEYNNQLRDVLGIGWKLLLISRETPPADAYPFLHLHALNGNDLYDVFERNLHQELAEEDVPYLLDIIEGVNGHTLAVELIAKQIHSSFLTIQEAAELIRHSGFSRIALEAVDYQKDQLFLRTTIAGILDKLFEIDHLSEQEQIAMKLLSLFDMPGIDIHLFQNLSGMQTKDPINSLLRIGWISERNGKIWLHPVTGEYVSQWPWQGAVDYESEAQKLMENLYKQIHVGRSAADTDKQFSPNYPALYGLLKLANEIVRRHQQPSAIRQRLIYHLAIDAPVDEEETAIQRLEELLDSPQYLDSRSILRIYSTAAFMYGRMDRYDKTHEKLRQMRSYLRKHPNAHYMSVYYQTLSVNLWNKDSDKNLHTCLKYQDRAIAAARLSKHPESKTQLAMCLLNSAMSLMKCDRDLRKCRKRLWEASELVEQYAQPLDEVRYQCYRIRAIYYAHVEQNAENALLFLEATSRMTKASMDSDLSWIDHLSDTCVSVYSELGMDDDVEEVLLEGIQYCEKHPDALPYLRKKKELIDLLCELQMMRDKQTDVEL